jgi:outer membrane protein assembly factor BamB
VRLETPIFASLLLQHTPLERRLADVKPAIYSTLRRGNPPPPLAISSSLGPTSSPPLRALLLTAIVSVVAPLPALIAADWPQYRGPKQDGTSQESVHFPPSGPQELWRTSVGVGSSAVSTSGDRAFTMGNREGRDRIICLDTKSGKTLWEHDYQLPLDRRMFEGGPAATPTVDGDRLYTLSHQGDLFCLNALTGEKIWYRHCQQDFGGKRPQWGFAGSPTVEGSLLILDIGGKDASTVALDKLTGNLVWKSGNDEAGYASAVVCAFEGRRTALLFKAKALIALAPGNGAELWRIPWKTSYEVNSATPLVFGNKILISSGYGTGCALYEIRAGQPVELWRNRLLRAHVNTPLYWKGYIYGIDGQAEPKSPLVCLNAEDGSLQWSEKGVGGSVILAKDQLVLLSERGELIVAPASPKSFAATIRFQSLGGRSWVQPTLSNGRLFLKNNQGELVCIDATLR